MKNFSGVFTALITPFKNGDIDEKSLRKLVRHQLDNGIEGFVVNGTTAESPALNREERKRIFKIVESETSGQVPLVMGTGSNNTRDTVDATQDAQSWGADAALVVVPYYNKPPQRGLEQHFIAVAKSSDIPVLLYNVPGRTITKLEVETIASLSRIPNIIGVKEATGDVAFGKRVMEASKDGFLVTSGDDATCLELTENGGAGVISVGSHILPKQFVTWNRRAHAQDKSWRTEFSENKELIDYLYVESNPIPVKMALALMGIIESPELRLPMASLIEPYTTELKTKMKSRGLL